MSKDEELPEELALEIEALGHVYGDDSFHIECNLPSDHLRILFPLFPRNLDGDHEAYVAATLVLSLHPTQYPATPPTVCLQDTKGLSDVDAHQLEGLLRSECESDALAGELILGHVCETALDLLTTEYNTPHGPCAICLAPLSTTTVTPTTTLKLPCFHVFHEQPCFASWFRWQQQQRRRKEEEVTALTPCAQLYTGEDVVCSNGDGNGARVIKGVYSIACPICRLDISPHTLSHALPRFCIQAGNSNGSTTRNDNGSTHGGPRSRTGEEGKHDNNDGNDDNAVCVHVERVLSSLEMEALRSMQAKNRTLLDCQRKRGGLVAESVAVSLAELELMAAAAESSKRVSGSGGGGSGGGGSGGGSRKSTNGTADNDNAKKQQQRNTSTGGRRMMRKNNNTSTSTSTKKSGLKKGEEP